MQRLLQLPPPRALHVRERARRRSLVQPARTCSLDVLDTLAMSLSSDAHPLVAISAAANANASWHLSAYIGLGPCWVVHACQATQARHVPGRCAGQPAATTRRAHIAAHANAADAVPLRVPRSELRRRRRYRLAFRVPGVRRLHLRVTRRARTADRWCPSCCPGRPSS